MADGALLPGDGLTVATDDIGGVHHQLVKLEFGDPDSATQVSATNRLPVALGSAVVTTQGVQDTATTSSITTATSVVGPISVSQRNVVTATISGTYAGVSFVLESSPDGTIWTPLQAVDVSTGFVGTTWTPAANQSLTIECAVGASTQVRLRATAWASGSAAVTVSAQSQAYEPVPTAIVQACDRDLTATNVTAVNNDLFSLDCAGVKSIQLQLTGTFAGTLTFQGSNDGTVWNTINAVNASSGVVATTATAVGLFEIPVRTRYVRARVTTYTSGTWAGVYRLSSMPSSPNGTTQPVSGTVTATAAGQAAHSAAVSGNPVRVGGKVVTAVDTTLVANDTSDMLMTTGGAQIVKAFSAPETDWQYTGVLTTTTAAAAKGAGAAGVRNYVTDISFQNTSATATTVLLLDGATTLAQWNAPANMALPAVIQFSTPRRGTAATALNVNCGTTGANVLVNVGGYQAP